MIQDSYNSGQNLNSEFSIAVGNHTWVTSWEIDNKIRDIASMNVIPMKNSTGC